MSWHQRTLPNGFLQFRETGGRWHYQVYGFSGECDDPLATCSVYAVEGKRECPIDVKGRVLIDGKRYSRHHWDH